MRLVLSALVAAGSLALPAVAHADTVENFMVSGQGLDLTFSLPTSPVVGNNYSQGFFFYLGDVNFSENGTSKTASNVYFYTKADDGGFTLANANGSAIDDLDFTGPVLFTGGVKQPTFKEGMFALTGNGCGVVAAEEDGPSSCSYNLKIAPASAATPEPGSLFLLGTGALGAVGVLRRRLSL